MFMVYWTEVHIEDGLMPHEVSTAYSQHFDGEKMLEAMALMESLRKKKYAGQKIFFISMCSENPNQVGKMGVDVVDANYNWTKRRYNERPAAKPIEVSDASAE